MGEVGNGDAAVEEEREEDKPGAESEQLIR